MVNDVLSAIVSIVAVNQLPLNNAVVGKGDTIKLLATPARNCQSATAGLLLLFHYCIDSMLMLFLRTNVKYEGFTSVIENVLLIEVFWGQAPDAMFFHCTYLFTQRIGS